MPLEPIAIVGIGCRFPQANNPVEFWQLLQHGVDAITEVPPERWSLDRYYHPDSTQPNKTNTRWGGFLKDLDKFEPQFFGISPKEAKTIDPQQRLLLEVAYEALEDGGQLPERLAGTKTSVFIGIGTHDYSILLWQKPVNEPYATTGTGNCVAANRISYAFDLKGASVAVDTACSSSLVAVHLACQSIWHGESNLALAGGVNVLLTPNLMVGFSKGGFMSPDGRCKSFAANANGYVRSEGAGIILLKPLSQARADGDRIYAVIRATAVNQDGLTNGLPAPNPKAQEAVLREAYRQAGIEPHTVDYIEAHGTGTRLGDAVELQALGAVIGQNRPQGDYCAIGSVKTNIGHAETAAGIAGLIKTALVLKHQAIPPSLHCQQPNPSVDWDGLGLKVQQDFTASEINLAGVNSFGFGGTNAHIVLESEVRSQSKSEVRSQKSKGLRKDITTVEREDKTNLLLISAKNDGALRELAAKYLEFFQSNKDASLSDICHTANTRRTHYSHRLALVGKTKEDFCQQLEEFIVGKMNSVSHQLENKSIAFLFTGQGSQYVGMARQLYQTAPLFRKNLDRCFKILKSELGESLSTIIYPRGKKNHDRIDETAFTQPALFAIEYSLAQLWLSWGIKPAVLMGHSVGEYVAATIAGVFSLEDGLKLIAARGSLMQQLPQDGAMVAVYATETFVRDCISAFQEDVSIAAINSRQNVVISGKKAAIDEIIASLIERGIKTTPLKVSHAFHSPLMEAMIPEFRRIAGEITYNLPQIPIISNLTGDFVTEEITTPEYWCKHIRKPVNFAASIQKLESQGYHILLEIGAKPILLGMARECLTGKKNLLLPSLRSGVEDWQQIALSLSQLYLNGVNVDRVNLNPCDRPHIISLPTYPFQKQRYWLEDLGLDLEHSNVGIFHGMSLQETPSQQHPLLGNRLDLAGVDETRFQAIISRDNPVYLKDHCVFDRVVFPATAYLEIFYGAATNIYRDRDFILKEFKIEAPLILPENETIELQVVVDRDNNLTLYSRTEEEETRSFTKQATAIIQIEDNSNKESLNLSELIAEFDRELDIKSYYAEMQQQGLKYGTCFQGIQQIFSNNKEAIGKIKLPEALIKYREKYYLHPALIDACLQVLGATFTETEKRNTFLPVSIDKIQVYQSIEQQIWSYIRIVKSETQTKQIDIQLIDNNGTIAAKIEGLILHQTGHRTREYFSNKPASTNNNFDDWLYELTWQPQPLLLDIPEIKNQSWLILADRNYNLGKDLARLIDKKGHHCIMVFDDRDYQKIDDRTYTISTTNPQHFQELLKDLNSIDNIVHLWSLDSNEIDYSDGNKLDFAHQNHNTRSIPKNIACASTLFLIQSLQKNKQLQPKLWLITNNSQSITSHLQQIQQAPLWGLAKVINLEYPDLNCTCLDLDLVEITTAELNGNDTPEAIEILVQELLFSDTEKQIAYHQNTRHVARLKRQTPAITNQPLQLQISRYGSLDNLTTIPLQRHQPSKGEVEIQVLAAGVNFRDVLNALGMLREVMAEMGFDDAAQIPFGGECAGKIVAIGEGVTDLQIGDEVIAACALGSLASFVTVNSKFVVIKPQNLSFIEAATIPTTFLTAYYGLVDRAQIKRDDRILIHSAAGGVGQAAIQIAQSYGAEILATASQGKWEYLQSLGIEKIMDSRSLDFAKTIKELTAGAGVDIVLNSLNGEYIPKSLTILAKGGRFVEIGKLGIWNVEQIRDICPESSYFCFDLLEIARENPDIIQSLLQKLIGEFATGKLKPLPYRVFPLDKAAEGFRLMAQGKHIGKVVIAISQTDTQETETRKNSPYLSIPNSKQYTPVEKGEGSYLITGGFGALGLTVAEWLVVKGARELILVGRNQPSEIAKARIKALEAKGVIINSVFADISQLEAVETIIQNYPQLKGVIHAAGILDDRMLVNLTWERFDRVLSPKIDGGWNLHHCTQKLPLDFFICFSSIVSSIGSFGQGSYGAANAFLDALARYRQQLGLPALTINWGAWADIGMAAKESETKWQDLGITPLKPKEALTILDRLLEEGRINVGVINVNWQQFLSKTKQIEKNRLFESLIKLDKLKVDKNKPKSTFIEQLASDTIDNRIFILNDYLRDRIAKVLGFNNTEAIDIDADFSDLGMDSLMAVELVNLLQTQLAINLNSSILFDYPTVEALTSYLLSQLSLDACSNGFNDYPSTKEDTHNTHNHHLPKNTNTHNYPPEYYQFELTPEYLNLQQDLYEAKQIGNTFFLPHQRIAADTTTIDDRILVNYASYNYLGMSGDKKIIQATQNAIKLYGTSVSASRIVSGEIPLHQELETEIAEFLHKEAAIVYIGGHLTNVNTIGHLFGDRDLIVCDSLSHNSIRQGCQLSGATVIEFPHNDCHKLAEILEQHRHKHQKVLIAIEGVYSSDGDIAPLPEIIALKKRYSTMLMVDEAHSIGVLGKTGKGIGEYFGIESKDIDLWMGTLSKSLASCGGYIAANRAIVEYLKYTSPGFVFSVGMSPANTAAALASLRLLKQEPARVIKLQQNAQLFLNLARDRGFNTGNSQDTPIVPIIIGSRSQALYLSQLMFRQGIHVQPMVYPSVPKNGARLRFFLSCTHTEEQIQSTLAILQKEIVKIDGKIV